MHNNYTTILGLSLSITLVLIPSVAAVNGVYLPPIVNTSAGFNDILSLIKEAPGGFSGFKSTQKHILIVWCGFKRDAFV